MGSPTPVSGGNNKLQTEKKKTTRCPYGCLKYLRLAGFSPRERFQKGAGFPGLVEIIYLCISS